MAPTKKTASRTTKGLLAKKVSTKRPQQPPSKGGEAAKVSSGGPSSLAKAKGPHTSKPKSNQAASSTVPNPQGNSRSARRAEKAAVAETDRNTVKLSSERKVALSREHVDIGLSKEERQGVVDVLGQVLADQHVLYVKLRNVHWNIIGARFHDLHELFEAQYTAVALAIDETAERIRKLGGVSPGSLKEFVGLASLKELPGALIHGDTAIRAILDDNETVIRSLRKFIDRVDEDLGDVGTADFLTDLIREHEKAAWMLRVYLD